MNILEEIIAYKKIEIERSKENLPLDRLKKLIARRDAINSVSTMQFVQALKNKINKKQIALIAEIKKASPSRGILKKDFNLVNIAKAYKAGGATCLSVLTDEKYFQGNLNHIKEIKSQIDLPVLRKDFIIDPYQIYESIYNQADCILLIAGAVDKNQLKELFKLSGEIGIDVLIEIHDEYDMDIALTIVEACHGMSLFGINNRDLKTFQIDLNTTINLVSKYKQDLKNKIIVSESGIVTNEDIKLLIKHGVYVFLVGESLMREQDIEGATKRLLGK